MIKRAWTAACVVGLLAACAGAVPGAVFINATGTTGGLVVHLGCGQAGSEGLTASLRPSEAYTVHGLALDAAAAERARKAVRNAGLYGPVAVDRLAGAELPYVDNLVNLVVAEKLGRVPMAEMMRVLRPGGVAYVKSGSAWTPKRKPRPGAIDDWTHYLHGPDNNAVAADTVVGPPRRLQWQAGPKWTRHHDKMSSFSAMVSAGGRVFYILDEGSTASIYLPSRWRLIARDAFNGKRLWSRKIATWYTRFKGLKDGPADAPRRLVVSRPTADHGGRVYATLDLEGPVTALDAVTGKTVGVYKGSERAEEIVLDGGTLFVLIGPGSIGDGGRMERPVEKRTMLALDAESGRVLWRHKDVVAALTMAVDPAGVYYFNFDTKHAVALDRTTGKERWRSAAALPSPPKQRSFFASKLVVHSGVVLFAGGENSGMTKSGGGETRWDTLTALAAATGKTLWQAKHPPSGYSSPENMFVIDGLVWCDNSSNGRSNGEVVAYDLRTGTEKRRFPSDQENYWFHHRCYAGRATTKYVLTSRTGVEFIDLAREKWDLNHWVRGACLYGVMPCNGLLYAPPAPCICYAETMLHSFNAFAPAPASASAKATADRSAQAAPRLEKGPAYALATDKYANVAPSPDDWPTYRGGAARHGVSRAAVPAKLRQAWSTQLAGRLSAPVVAGAMVFVAEIDRHAVCALRAGDGKLIWRFVAGGRVDSPPTVFGDRVLFGSADGYVYCLRAEDGVLAWRFRAAPADRRTLVYEQVESLWPVHGSVLVHKGVACFVAGRSAFVDCGMTLFRLDALTGKLLSQTPLTDRNPATGENLQDTVKWLNMAVARPDVLSCDGQRIYMRSQSFDLSGTRMALGPKVRGPAEGTRQGGPGTHLFCPTGFLDDTWFHRTYWLFGQTWSSGWNGYYIAGKHAPAGRILCVDDDRVYAFGRRPQYYRWTTPLEYRLFAANRIWRKAPPRVPPKPAAKAPAPAKGKAAVKGRGKAGAKGKRRTRKPAGPTPVTHKQNYAWTTNVPILVRAMVLTGGGKGRAGKTLFVAGPKDVFDEAAAGRRLPANDKKLREQERALLGQSGGVLWAVSATDGTKLAALDLPAPPVFDGLAAAGGALLVSTTDGQVICLGAAR